MWERFSQCGGLDALLDCAAKAGSDAHTTRTAVAAALAGAGTLFPDDSQLLTHLTTTVLDRIRAGAFVRISGDDLQSLLKTKHLSLG